jgi:hypothetical protein
MCVDDESIDDDPQASILDVPAPRMPNRLPVCT